MIVENFFNEYQKLIHSGEKLEFLHKSLKEANNDERISKIIHCLIALEDNYINSSNINNSGNIVEFCREYFTDSSNDITWWLFTEGVIYLKLGKYNLDNCLKAEELFEKFLIESKLKQKPSFYLFYLGHVAYQIGNLENDIINSEKMLNKALDCFNEIIHEYTSLEDSYKAIIYNMLGNIHIKLENLCDNPKIYNISEEYYSEAIKLNSKFPFPYNGLGNIYRERGNYAEAIEKYIAATNYDKDFVYPWNYMGDCFRHLEKYEIAYRCYEHAMNICKDKSVIYPIYGLGRIYYELGNRNNNNEKYYKKAIEYFEDIIEKSIKYIPQIRFTLKDLGGVYQKLGRYFDAINAYKKILDNNLFNKQRNYEEFIEESITTCKEKINLIEKCSLPTDETENNPLDYVMCKIYEQGIEKRVNDMKESFDVNFLRREKIGIEKFNEIKNKCSDSPILSKFIEDSIKNGSTTFLHILRRWNSYTPIINNSRGGGYYLKVNDIGIIIDPGFNFIKSFKEAKHKFSDIDIILLTHSHDDHTSDLESILNMQYRYNSSLEKTVLPREVAKECRKTSEEVKKDKKMESIINKRYSDQKKKLVLYTSQGVFSKFSGILKKGFLQVHENNYFDIIKNSKDGFIKDSKDDYIKNDIFLKILNVGDKVFINNGITIHAIKANHKDLNDNRLCLGFVIELDDTIIVYTGDTGWYDKENKESLQKQYEYIKENNTKSKKIVLIAHLGGFNKDENNYWYKEIMNIENEEMYYDNHLGRIGLVKLVQALMPDICIISEFGEEFNGIRIKIAEIFQKAFEFSGHNVKFIPGDIGLLINLEKKTLKDKEIYSPKIKVISAIDFKNKTIIYDYVDPENVAFGEYRDQNSLFYYKKDSNIIESDCIQAFIDGFIDDNEVNNSFLKLDF